MITFQGKTQTASAGARELKLKIRTVHSRMAKGMDPVKALTLGKTHANTTHGQWRSREYRAWIDMRARCNPNYSYRPGWKNYGGRKIHVCKRWLNSFENFLRDVGPAPSPKHELDRKNVNGHYTPNNVRWVTHRRNSWNRRNTTFVKFNGKVKPLQEWCIELNLNRRKTARRLSRGMLPEQAFSQ